MLMIVTDDLVKTFLLLQYFATGTGTASYQDYEEYEFVECLSEETQIIDLFTNCNLQPHKLSQCTLATRLKSLVGGGGKALVV